MERRFNDQLRDHEDNEFAHSPMRHAWVSDTITPALLRVDLARQALEGRVMKLEQDARSAQLIAAEAAGEARATRRILRYWGTTISLLVTAFGAAILIKLHVL